MKLLLTLIALFWTSIPLMAVEAPKYSDLLPKFPATNLNVADINVQNELQTCFGQPTPLRLPSGYMRFKLTGKDAPNHLEVDLSTYQDKFVPSCVEDTMKNLFGSKYMSAGEYLHVVSECGAFRQGDKGQKTPTDLDCSLAVYLSREKNIQLDKGYVETHVREARVEHPKALKLIYGLISLGYLKKADRLPRPQTQPFRP